MKFLNACAYALAVFTLFPFAVVGILAVGILAMLGCLVLAVVIGVCGWLVSPLAAFLHAIEIPAKRRVLGRVPLDCESKDRVNRREPYGHGVGTGLAHSN